jgi:hypothetical protein
MSLTRYTVFFVLSLVFLLAAVPCFSQYGISFKVDKPKEFEKRQLRSEKPQKKFTVTRRFMQNTITHYNYFFNANNKLNEVLDKAKLSFTDDFSQLIPFYNYSLDVTAADSISLDSISYKSQTGIVLHDLRNDWADNLYLLWGAAYYLRKDFDSARMMFQFINYAFAEKEKDGSYKTIGSNRDGTNAFTISTVEKNSLPRRVFSEPPSRNESFIWQIRNALAQDDLGEAATLIDILKNDPVFPERLRDDLEEVQALYFYKQELWDSCAQHLAAALGNAVNKQEKARWEFLLGQLYEKTKRYDEAEEYYSKVIGHTTNLVMEIYARLGAVRVNKDEGENYIEDNIATLVKMAHRDKYVDYRDIIYFMAGQMELERNNYDGAIKMLAKSLEYPSTNATQRNKIFLQLADLSFFKRYYRQSYNYYDSLNLEDPLIKDAKEIEARKILLAKIADNIEVVQRQDSLQKLAALPENERKDLVKKLVRKLRRQQGLKEEPAEGFTTGSNDRSPPPNLFAEPGKKGEWYFYNASSRQKGLTDFKAKWGSRPNADNWRRSAAVSASIQNRLRNSQSDYDKMSADIVRTFPPEGNAAGEMTFDGLYGHIPLTPEQQKASNDSIQNALFTLGVTYAQQLEDCAAATETLEALRLRFPDFANMEEVLFNLYFCYGKQGETAKAAAIKKLLNDNYGDSNFTAIINTGKNPQAAGPQSEATRTYEKIYDLFIEGNFLEAVEQKRKADSIYSRNYWTPQLLYIEAIYYVRQREDSMAKKALNNIISQFANSPLKGKAVTMLDVLNRRAQIEEELRNLVVNRPDEDTTTRYRPLAPVVTNPPVNAAPVKKDSIAVAPPVQQPVVITPKTDSVAAKPPQQTPVAGYSFVESAPHYVVIILNKVDPVFVNEARNAFFRYNRDTYYNKQMQAELVNIDADNRLLLISPFQNAQEALEYIERTRPRTASEIIPWLRGGKYYYSIITEKNLEVLKGSKDIEKYHQFIEERVPGKLDN